MRIVKKEYNIDTLKKVEDSTVVTISDLHLSDETDNKLLEQLLCKIGDLNPDYICFLGDITNTLEYLNIPKIKDLYLSFMRELNQIKKTIVILGNHDLVVSKKLKEELSLEEKLMYFEGFKDSVFLDNDCYNDGNINFINYSKKLNSYYREWDDIHSLYFELYELSCKIGSLIDKEQFNILLSHSPVGLFNELILKQIKLMRYIDLVLSGHTHNGMVPNFIDNGLSNNGLNFRFDLVGDMRNLVNNGNHKLIINGGITKIDKFKPKLVKSLRFLYPAEIDIVKIKTK